MQENLLFFGIDESLSDDRSKSEDTERVLKDFVKTNVSSEDNNIDADSIQLDRVHRLGRPRLDSDGNLLRPRPIVAKFEKFKDREAIRMEADKLDKKYSIKEHFPVEIENRRKVLYPELKRAKANPENKARIVRDKLIINGKVFTHEDFPPTKPNRNKQSQTGSRFTQDPKFKDNDTSRDIQIGRHVNRPYFRNRQSKTDRTEYSFDTGSRFSVLNNEEKIEADEPSIQRTPSSGGKVKQPRR